MLTLVSLTFLQRKEMQWTLNTDPGELSMEKEKQKINKPQIKDGSSPQDREKTTEWRVLSMKMKAETLKYTIRTFWFCVNLSIWCWWISPSQDNKCCFYTEPGILSMEQRKKSVKMYERVKLKIHWSDINIYIDHDI